jgi:superfamily II DNA helicase RecQ
MAGQPAISVISPLNSIIKDQLDDLAQQGYRAVDLSSLSSKVAFSTAEMVNNKEFRELLKDPTSPFHQNIAAIFVDESHTLETWTGKQWPAYHSLIFT